jgi:hypothetical protein
MIGRQSSRRWTLAAPLAAAFFAVAACGSADATGSTPARETPANSGGPFTTRLVVPAGPVVQGTTVEAVLEVTNRTGKPRDLAPPGTCKQKWGLGLRSDALEAVPYFTLDCEPGPLVIGTGTSRFPLSIRASYQACSQHTDSQHTPASASSPRCGPGNTMPPLPAGDYEARVHGLSGIPEPAPVTIRLVAR